MFKIKDLARKLPPKWRKRIYSATVLAGVIVPALAQAGVIGADARSQAMSAIGAVVAALAAANVDL